VRTFDDAQNEIISAQSAEGLKNQMKTTAVALSIIGGKLAWGHVGDSRMYHFKRGKLVSRTIDHSVSQMLALAKEIDESEIASHPDRSRLLRAFGDKWDAPRYELSKEISLRRDSAFLLCSDGVWEHLPGGHPPAPQCDDAQRWISDMFTDVAESGHQTGDNDNYSAIAVIVK
jgi:serine/threonine protein phosphatase PrpC